MILYMSNLSILTKDFIDIRVRVTGLLGYLSMLSAGDFKDEEISKVTSSCKGAVPIIRNKLIDLANAVVDEHNTKLKTVVEENSLRVLMKLDHILDLLESKNHTSTLYTWDEEVSVAKSAISDLSKIHDVVNG